MNNFRHTVRGTICDLSKESFFNFIIFTSVSPMVFFKVNYTGVVEWIDVLFKSKILEEREKKRTSATKDVSKPYTFYWCDLKSRVSHSTVGTVVGALSP